MKFKFVFLFLLLVSSAFSQTPYFNYPIDTIVRDSYFNYKSMVKYDNNGFIHIVNSRQFDTESLTTEIYYRTNKSGVFTSIRVTNNTVNDNYASLGFDNLGNVHICWERKDASGNFQVIYTNNRNMPNGFGDSVWITTAGYNKATPYMAVGKGDSLVHFVYYTYAPGQNNAYYKNYNYVTGQSGAEVFLGPAQTGSENDIEVAVDGLNKIHIVYCTNANISGGAIKYFTNESGSLTEVYTGLSANTMYPGITIDNNNVLYIVYKLSTDKRIYEMHKSPGGTLSVPFAITVSGLGSPAYWHTIDTDDNGTLYVTFQNSQSGTPKGFFLVYGKGNTYSNPVLVFEDSTSSYTTRFTSSVTARGNGQIAITFNPGGTRNNNVICDILMKRGIVTPVGIAPTNEIPAQFILYQNYPNPFNPYTKFKIDIPPSSRKTSEANGVRGMIKVKLAIYDILGKEISVLVNEQLTPGTYEVEWNAKDYPSGVYFYRLMTGEFTQTNKMVLVK